MISRRLFVLALVLACESRSLLPAGMGGGSGAGEVGGSSAATGGGGTIGGATGMGAAGTMGAGGTTGGSASGGSSCGAVAGSSGSAGTAGTPAPSPLPECNGLTDGSRVDFALEGPTGGLANATVAVTVASIDGCDKVACPYGTSTSATRFLLAAAGGQTWRLYLRIAKMPADLITVGDALTLTVGGRTAILSRGCDLVAFASSYDSIPAPVSLPDLRAAGIDVTDGGATCVGTGSCNWFSPHAVIVSFGGETATVNSGQTAMIGRLSFVNDAFVQVQNNHAPCDGPSSLRLAGFRVP